MSIRSCFCLLKIILYIVLFGKIDRRSFSVAHPEHIWKMSFSSHKAIYYPVDIPIPVLFHNRYIKTLVVLKPQWFGNSGSDETELRDSKRRRFDAHDNEEEKDLNEFEDEDERENIGYILLLFVAFLRKESIHPTDMGERTRNINYLVCI